MLYCGFTIHLAKLKKLRDSITSRVGELVVIVGIWFLVDASSGFRFYVEGFMQDGSQLIG
jgi:hypothetical protein